MSSRLILDDAEQRVLEAVGKSERGLTVHGAWQQAQTWRNWNENEVRGVLIRLVRKGYLKREGTEVLRWYTVTSLGRGYLSVKEEDDHDERQGN